MWVGFNLRSVNGQRLLGWVSVALAALLLSACSSGRDNRAEAADADRRAASGEAAPGDDTDDVLAAFDAWAKDSGGGEGGSGDGERLAGGGGKAAAGALDGVIEQFNRKVSMCWKQPFGMPRLATVRLLVQFNPDGTVRNVAPQPEASEALQYRTEAPYLVMIAHTTQALRKCQPYDGIRRNYTELSQLEMVVDPRMFQH